MIIGNNQNLTRMHSSRMHTAHLLPVSPSMYCSGMYFLRGCTFPWRVYLPREGVPAQWGVPAQGGVPAWGVYLPWGCACPGGVPARRCTYQGVPSRGCTCPGGTCPGTCPPLNRMTDRCKNITLPQTSLRAVISILPRISRIKLYTFFDK